MLKSVKKYFKEIIFEEIKSIRISIYYYLLIEHYIYMDNELQINDFA